MMHAYPYLQSTTVLSDNQNTGAMILQAISIKHCAKRLKQFPTISRCRKISYTNE